ncbi:MAG: hypothetical protein IIC35_04750 [Gemmatimonadetes bacterium]|nr:hypothetical protein [Gemmatimonadota bacterium]
MRRAAIVGALRALLASPNGVIAQMSPGARSVAMGGGGMVFATGVDAVEWNPANLGWAGGWTFLTVEVGVSAISLGATFDEILAILGEDVLGAGDLDVAQIINNLPSDGFRLSAVSEGYATAWGAEKAELPTPTTPLPTVGIAIGPIGIRVRSRFLSEMTLSKELADLIGNGFVQENIQSYAVGNTGWRTTSFSEVTVSYGTTLGGLLSVGVGGRYVMGHGMISGRFFEPEIDLSCIGDPLPPDCTPLSVQTVAVEATTGTGYGLDIGFSLALPAGFRAAVSGTNVVQRMTWDEGLVSHSATFTDQDFDDAEDFIDLLDRFETEPVTPNAVSLAVYEASRGLFEESYFPQVFRAGLGWQAGGTSLEAVGIKVSPRGRYASAWDERISIGIEQKLPLLTLRAGMARAPDGLGALTGGVGLGLGPLKIEASGGKFTGREGALWDGYYGTIAIQIKGGGS